MFVLRQHTMMLITIVTSSSFRQSAAVSGESMQKSFSPTHLPTNGSAVCANDFPSSAAYVDDIVGIPLEVPDEVKCSYYCTGFPNCTSFNVRFSMPRKCETYDFVPRNCSTTSPDVCQHFQLSGTKTSCAPLTTIKKYVEPALTNSISGSGGVFAFAMLNSKLFVAREDATAVDVFDTTSFQLLNQLNIPGVGSKMYGLATCATNNYLYVSDFDNMRVYVFDLSTAKMMRSFGVGIYPYALSMNRAHNILVAGDKGFGSNFVQEYTPTGTLARQIPDSNTMFQAVELSTDIVAVSRFSGVVQGIFTASMVDGRVLRSYGNQPGSGVGQMSSPTNLAVSEDGYILVCDMKNERILVINPSLTDVRTLFVPTPYLNAILLDQSGRQLFVGQWGGRNDVSVYNIDTNFAALFTQ